MPSLEIYPVVRDSPEGFSLREPTVIPKIRVVDAAWSQDSAKMLLAIHLPTPEHRYFPRLHILDVESGSITQIADAVPPLDLEPGGTRPLAWTAAGLFAHSQSRVLRCDPTGGGCTLVHEFEDWQRIRGGTAVGDGRAYVLVTDIRPNPFETRANELHEVDLLGGSAKLLVRMPDDVFLEDIDWIAD